MNNTGNKIFVSDPLHKKEKRGSKSIVVAKKPTISIYRDSAGGWHCDINVHGYVYGAIRHSREEIEGFAIEQTMVQLSRGVKLITNDLLVKIVDLEKSSHLAWIKLQHEIAKQGANQITEQTKFIGLG